MIISCMTFKGGAGKTMLATNLAVVYAHQGRKVCVIDTDESRASTKWVGRRAEADVEPAIPIIQCTEPRTIIPVIQEQRQNYDVILIDGPPSLFPIVTKIVLLSDLIIVPILPKGGNDIEVTQDFLERYEEIQQQRTDDYRTPAYLLPNMVKESYNLHTAYIDNLPHIAEDYNANLFKVRIGELVAFGETNQLGLGVYEYSHAKAKDSIEQLAKEIDQILNN